MEFICRQLRFSYERKAPLFDEYSHTFKRGVTLLKGYSGCGKTTLLKLMAGYLRPHGGELIPPVPYKVTSGRYRRYAMSYMFQGMNLLPLLSVERNMAFAAELSLLSGRRRRERMNHLLEELGLFDFRKKKVDSLSGGQQQRAALARTLMKEPKVLLLDEPTSGLDDDNTSIIKRMILREGGNAVCVICTHDTRLLEIADEVIDFNDTLSC